jgi:hypothetical protein
LIHCKINYNNSNPYYRHSVFNFYYYQNRLTVAFFHGFDDDEVEIEFNKWSLNEYEYCREFVSLHEIKISV